MKKTGAGTGPLAGLLSLGVADTASVRVCLLSRRLAADPLGDRRGHRED